jgi:energy-coupling factor transporter ATP-binding protein EcfA2
MAASQEDPAEEVLREMEQKEYENMRAHEQPPVLAEAQEDPALEVLREMEQQEYTNTRAEEQLPVLPLSQPYSNTEAVASPSDRVSPPPAPKRGADSSKSPMPTTACDSLGTRRRINGKRPAPLAYFVLEDETLRRILASALDAEDEDEPGFLAATVKRKHVHWTHVTTQDPDHKQPSEFTREAFWLHLAKCYKEVYPDVSSPTGSILAFGFVAKEFKSSAHKHCASFSLSQHYWNKVAKHSLAKYGVPLNAVAHDSYLTMFAYLRHPSKRKGMSELDPDPYYSHRHPRGRALQELIAKSHRSQTLQRNKSADGAQKKQRLSVFEEVKKHDLRDALSLRAHACKEADAGRRDLAEYCTRQAGKLEEVVSGARAVMEAPIKMKPANATLLEKLASAAEDLPCECGGRWASGAAKVLTNSRIPVQAFTSAVYNALRVGARRGANVACVGLGGCGKSTLLESFEKIFNAAGKPEKGSTFPLSSVKGCDIILWQDYEHDEGTVRFSDLLSLFVGESVGVRLPGQRNEKFRNAAPLFYSGRAPMRLRPSRLHDFHTADEYSGMMNERFTVFHFTTPIPKTERDMEFPQCGRCAANFYLSGGAVCQPQESLQEREGTAQGPVRMLAELHDLFKSGALSADEFAAMKSRVLASFLQ